MTNTETPDAFLLLEALRELGSASFRNDEVPARLRPALLHLRSIGRVRFETGPVAGRWYLAPAGREALDAAEAAAATAAEEHLRRALL